MEKAKKEHATQIMIMDIQHALKDEEDPKPKKKGENEE